MFLLFVKIARPLKDTSMKQSFIAYHMDVCPDMWPQEKSVWTAFCEKYCSRARVEIPAAHAGAWKIHMGAWGRVTDAV